MDMEKVGTWETKIKCEHCYEAQTHEQLGKNGTCKQCGKEIRKELF